jgi:hypothetical protein
VLDVVVAAGVRVAEQAALDRRHARVLADALRNGREVDTRIRRTRRRRGLLVGASLVVADEAIDILRILEVEGLVLPADADVALRAAALVRRHGLAEVVDQVGLAVDLAVVTGDVGDDALPVPVASRRHVVADLAVAVQALAGTGELVLGEVALVEADRVVAARRRAAVENVDDAIAVQVFRGEVRHAVLVQVPAIEPRRARRAVRAGYPVLAIIAFAAGEAAGQQQDRREAGPAHRSVLSCIHRCRSWRQTLFCTAQCICHAKQTRPRLSVNPMT